MIALSKRRAYGLAVLGIASAIGFLVYTIYALSLWRTDYATGWALLMLLVALTAFNVRKKLPVVPLGSSTLWLQVHVYSGAFSAVIFAMHVEFRVPNGWFEISLAALFGTVVVSGIVGLILSRSIPKRLQTRGEQVIFERQPVLLRQIRHDLESLMTNAMTSSSLSDFYASRLISFFAKPRHLWWHLMQSTRPCHALLSQLEALSRYLSAEERKIKDDIAELIGVKDDLDYHYAHQLVLKYWLFLHIPLSYSLLIVASAHGVLAYVYRGSA